MTLPLVTIGIPTRNRPIGLDRTLEKMRSQTYKNLEIIVSDNASDITQVGDICEKHCIEDSRVHWIRQESNVGAYNNCWEVLNKASGEYFLFAADDDDWPFDYVELLLKKIMLTNGSIAVGNLIFSTSLDSEFLSVSEKLCHTLFDYYEENDRLKRVNLYLEHSKHLECHMIYGLALTTTMHEAFSKVRSIYNHPLDMDWFIIFYIILKGHVCIEPRTFRVASFHPKSTTNELLAEWAKENGIAVKAKRLRLRIELCNIANGLSEFERHKINQQLNKMIRVLPVSTSMQLAKNFAHSVRSIGVDLLKKTNLYGFYRKIKKVLIG